MIEELASPITDTLLLSRRSQNISIVRVRRKRHWKKQDRYILEVSLKMYYSSCLLSLFKLENMPFETYCHVEYRSMEYGILNIIYIPLFTLFYFMLYLTL